MNRVYWKSPEQIEEVEVQFEDLVISFIILILSETDTDVLYH